MKVVNAPSKTNPQPKINKVGMENFLANPSQTPQEEVEVTKQTTPKKVEAKEDKENHGQIEEIENLVEEIERKLQRTKELEFSQFNQIIFEKKLLFKVLLIRDKIYVVVTDKDVQKKTVIRVEPPRWGGTSIRYLIMNCMNLFCQVTEKKTSKGTVRSYSPISTSSSNNDDIEDIFD